MASSNNAGGIVLSSVKILPAVLGLRLLGHFYPKHAVSYKDELRPIFFHMHCGFSGCVGGEHSRYPHHRRAHMTMGGCNRNPQMGRNLLQIISPEPVHLERDADIGR